MENSIRGTGFSAPAASCASVAMKTPRKDNLIIKIGWTRPSEMVHPPDKHRHDIILVD